MGCTHRAETASLCKSTADLYTVVALIQQPCINNNKILGLVLLVLHYTGVGTVDVGPCACILITGVVVYSLPQFGDTTVCLSLKVQNWEQPIVVTSIYMLIHKNYRSLCWIAYAGFIMQFIPCKLLL